MYPPFHAGENMIILKPTHMMAVSRAILFVNSGIVPSMQPKHRESIEHDIELLKEVHGYILQQIKEPGLPMSTIAESIIKIGETIGTKDSPS
jgi:hypothetical protein